MTEKEAIERLREYKTGDTEQNHVRADAILCEFLITLGYKAVVEAYDEVPKWYA